MRDLFRAVVAPSRVAAIVAADGTEIAFAYAVRQVVSYSGRNGLG
jgi:hypothetical protein